jgi:drug/metabolite transporter (DMT)-like permease
MNRVGVLSAPTGAPRRGVLRCLLAAVFFGASAPAASRLADTMPSVLLAGLLYVGAALAVLPATIRHPPQRHHIWVERHLLSLSIATGGLIGPVLLVAGLARTDAATASLLLNLELVATVVLAATIFREHLGHRVLLGAGLVTLGAVAVTWQGGGRPDSGALLIAAACVCWGIDNSATARIENLAPEHITLAKGVVAGATNTTIGIAMGVGATTVLDIPIALAIGVVGYGLSITLWVKGARDLGAARGQVIFATAPFIGAVIAWLVLGEQATSWQIGALVFAALGVGLTFRSAHLHRHEHQAVTHRHEHEHDEHHQHVHPDGVGAARHSHEHRHTPLVHAHPHVPDLHHRHPH